jgi:hypothetical protein
MGGGPSHRRDANSPDPAAAPHGVVSRRALVHSVFPEWGVDGPILLRIGCITICVHLGTVRKTDFIDKVVDGIHFS